jgi:hypothetical protein
LLTGFRLVHNPADKQSFVSKYVSQCGVDISVLNTVHSAMYALDTTQGVVERVNAHLKEFFELAYYMRRTGDPTVVAWSKKNQELVDIPSNEKALLKTIALFTNQEIEQWFDSMLGYNPIYCEGVEEGDYSLSASKKKRQNARVIVEKAFEQQMSQVPSYDSLSTLSQGIHHLDLPNTVKQDGFIYMVNGPAVYRGIYKDGGGDLEWSRVSNAVDKGILFEGLSKGQTWSAVEDVADLHGAPAIDMQKTYSDVRHILNGWVFDNHDVIAQYLAAYIVSLPIMRAMSNVNITLLTGESSSGKTTLSAGLLGGIDGKTNDCPSILESVIQVDNATLPAIYQNTDGKSHLVVFDESEQGAEYNQRYSEVLAEFIRLSHSIPHGGVIVRRGGRTKQELKDYLLRFPILMTAINVPSNRTFLSRTVEVRTRKILNHTPAPEFIEKHYSPAQLQTLRKNITLGLLPHIPELMQIRQRLSVDLRDIGFEIAKVDSRYLNNVLTPLAVHSFLGGDAKELYSGILTEDKGKLEAIHNKDPQNDLLNTCLYTHCIKVTTGASIIDQVSAQDLLLKKDYNILNASSCGVYYSMVLQAIVIVWRRAKFGALVGTKYVGWEVSVLREAAQKTELAIPNITQDQHNAIKNELHLLDVHSPSAYSVIDISYLISDLQVDDKPTVYNVDARTGKIIGGPVGTPEITGGTAKPLGTEQPVTKEDKQKKKKRPAKRKDAKLKIELTEDEDDPTGFVL